MFLIIHVTEGFHMQRSPTSGRDKIFEINITENLHNPQLCGALVNHKDMTGIALKRQQRLRTKISQERTLNDQYKHGTHQLLDKWKLNIFGNNFFTAQVFKN